jgi:hypothetical protein
VARIDGNKVVQRLARVQVPAGHPRLRFPIRPIKGRWPRWLERGLGQYFRQDPAVILDQHASPEAFRAAMAVVRVGETFKITWANRHPESDSLLLDNVDLADASIVDIGASDGSTSLDLIRRLPTFKSYVIADLYLDIYAARRALGHTLLYDADGQCILAFGVRSIAWPNLSRLVRLLYWPVMAAASRHPERYRKITLLNPAVRSLMQIDPRITCQVHDVFQPWAGDRPNVIKVANLLRRVYFSDAAICRGLDALMASLPDGGHMLLVDNPYIKGISSRAGLYRRQNGRFVAVALTEEIPEINDLVLRTDESALVGRQEIGNRAQARMSPTSAPPKS